MKQWFLDISIKKKLTIVLAGILLILILLLDVLVFYLTSSVLSQKIENQVYETTIQLSNNFDNKVEIINNKIIQIANDTNIQEELKDEISINEQDKDNYYSTYQKIRRTLVQVYNSNMMQDVEIYALNGDNYYISANNIKVPLVNERNYIREVSRNNGGILLFNDENGSVQFIKQIKDELTGKMLGIIRIGLKKEYLKNTAHSILTSLEGELLLSDKNSQIIIKDKRLSTNLDILSKVQEKEIINFHIQYQSSVTGWKTILTLNQEWMFKELNTLKEFIVSVSLLFYLLLLVIVSKISEILINPIKDITEGLKNFVAGNLNVRLEVNRNDELGIMSQTFNYTASRIESLIDEISYRKSLEKELKYKTLQAQVNPHFLYNTLDIINWMALAADEQGISKMILSLSDLFRYSINIREENASISDELDNIKNYLYIQQIRHSDRLKIYYEIDNNLLDLKLPKLTLQPLIENAINHGLYNVEAGGEIRVRLHQKDDSVLIEIKDNGIGIDQYKLQKISRELKDELFSNVDGNHIGLLTIHKRIQFLYGDKYGIDVISILHQGTAVIIKIPRNSY